MVPLLLMSRQQIAGVWGTEDFSTSENLHQHVRFADFWSSRLILFGLDYLDNIIIIESIVIVVAARFVCEECFSVKSGSNHQQ